MNKRKFWFRTIRYGIVSLISVAYVLLPLAFPDSVKFTQGHPFPVALGVLVIIGLVIAVEVVLERKEAADDAEGPLHAPSFSEAYPKSIAEAILILPDLAEYKPEKLALCQRQLLRTICGIVSDITESRSVINANVMIERSMVQVKAGGNEDQIRFLDRDRRSESFKCFLHLTIWAADNHCIDGHFILPVEGTRSNLLFGAPKSYVEGTVEVIADIRNKTEQTRLVRNQHPKIATQIKLYLNDDSRSFRSFVSVRLEHQNRCVGVLNVQSSDPGVFGTYTKPDRTILNYISPICAILASVISIENSPSSSDAPQPTIENGINQHAAPNKVSDSTAPAG